MFTHFYFLSPSFRQPLPTLTPTRPHTHTYVPHLTHKPTHRALLTPQHSPSPHPLQSHIICSQSISIPPISKAPHASGRGAGAHVRQDLQAIEWKGGRRALRNACRCTSVFIIIANTERRKTCYQDFMQVLCCPGHSHH